VGKATLIQSLPVKAVKAARHAAAISGQIRIPNMICPGRAHRRHRKENRKWAWTPEMVI
jgi:hypothetical protein